MQRFSKYLPFAIAATFFVIGLNAFLQSQPPHKNARIYNEVRHYSPYYLEKRFGGLEILSKNDPAFKEKPDNFHLYGELARLEKAWANTHLKRDGDTLLILDDNGTIRKRIALQTDDEKRFVKTYYGVE